MRKLIVRPVRPADAEAIASAFSPYLQLLAFLPRLHKVAEDRWFIENVILRECSVTVAELDGRIISFLAWDGDEIRLLHTHPEYIGQGTGSKLVEAAKACGVCALELWCFQANSAAQRFYERHGFSAIRFTDGTGNEEKVPDVRYRWVARRGARSAGHER